MLCSMREEHLWSSGSVIWAFTGDRTICTFGDFTAFDGSSMWICRCLYVLGKNWMHVSLEISAFITNLQSAPSYSNRMLHHKD